MITKMRSKTTNTITIMNTPTQADEEQLSRIKPYVLHLIHKEIGGNQITSLILGALGRLMIFRQVYR